jgi:hypothetical protein
VPRFPALLSSAIRTARPFKPHNPDGSPAVLFTERSLQLAARRFTRARLFSAAKLKRSFSVTFFLELYFLFNQALDLRRVPVSPSPSGNFSVERETRLGKD